jgi:hypothetical protein
MHVEIFDPLPAALFGRLVSCAQAPSGAGWPEAFRMFEHLSRQFPDAVFRREPYFYLDLKAKRSGCLFVEQESERLYFVYEAGGGKAVPAGPEPNE